MKVDLALAGYTWVAPTIVTSSSSTSVPRLFSPALGSKILFYPYGGQAGRCNTVINSNGPAGISFTGYMLAPNGGITITTQNTSAIEAFIEGLCLQITGNGTRFTGSGPSPTPVTTTTPATTTTTPASTNTVTTPGGVSVALEW